MSCDTLSPLPRLEMVGAFGGRGFLAALILPRGVEEGVMPAVAPPVEMERTAGRSADKCVGEALAAGLDGAGGEEGDGESKGVSESKSASGVVTVEAMATCVGVAAS